MCVDGVVLCAGLPAPFPYPPVDGVQGCMVESGGGSLTVSCSYDSPVLSGYLVVVQSAGSYAVRVEESRDASTAVEFEGLSDGLHSVVVFPLKRGSGLLGSSVAHTELVMVSASTSSSNSFTSKGTQNELVHAAGTLIGGDKNALFC